MNNNSPNYIILPRELKSATRLSEQGNEYQRKGYRNYLIAHKECLVRQLRNEIKGGAKNPFHSMKAQHERIKEFIL